MCACVCVCVRVRVRVRVRDRQTDSEKCQSGSALVYFKGKHLGTRLGSTRTDEW